jgi:hypothetical protein
LENARTAATPEPAGLDPIWRAAIEAHMADFEAEPESFDSIQQIAANIARHRARLASSGEPTDD